MKILGVSWGSFINYVKFLRRSFIANYKQNCGGGFKNNFFHETSLTNDASTNFDMFFENSYSKSCKLVITFGRLLKFVWNSILQRILVVVKEYLIQFYDNIIQVGVELPTLF